MKSIELLSEMKDFIDGNTTIEQFSFAFEESLARASDDLKSENEKLFHLLNEDMPELCANYEPDLEQRKQYPDIYYDEVTVRGRTKEIYIQALEMLVLKQEAV